MYPISRRRKNRIMRHVYGVWFVRRILPVFAVEIAVFSVVLASIQSYMSFSAVLENVWARATHFHYWLSMMTDSEFTVKLLLLSVVIIGALLMRDAFRLSKGVRGNFLRLLGVSNYT